MHIALSKHHEARGGDRAHARETGVPHGGRLKRARQWLLGRDRTFLYRFG